jgi:hypothetical protein
MEVTGVACADPPVNPDPVGAVQVYVVPAGAVDGVTENALPLQTVAVSGETVGNGLTVIVTVFEFTVVPQPSAAPALPITTRYMVVVIRFVYVSEDVVLAISFQVPPPSVDDCHFKITPV